MAVDIETLRNCYETLRGTEHAKNQLIEELLQGLDALSQEHQREKLDHAREKEFNRTVQLREEKLLDDNRMLRTRIDRDAFILVLIDGDGMIFEDRLIQRGEAGGKEAAGILWNAVREYVQHNIPGIPSDYKIVARVYANLKGLGDICNKAGILDSPYIMDDFTRGFTGSKQLFDFIDVGIGKDRADDKVSELFKLYLYNCHCRHIIFGCSHDNGYARLLEDVIDQAMPNQITLLEGVPFERELAGLKGRLSTTRFNNLFRPTKINIYQSQSQLQYMQPQPNRPPAISQPQSMPQMLPNQMRTAQAVPLTHSPQQFMQQNGVNNGASNGIKNQPIASLPSQPPQTAYQSPYPPGLLRTPSQSTDNSAMIPMATSWATKAVSGPPAQVASPPPTPQPVPSDIANKIARNKYGQRIDPVLQYDKTDVKRVQKIHMCNVHFLRQDCPYGNDCTHDHSYKPNKNEIMTLRAIARQTPCHFGTACDDVKCIYGHRCPQSMEGIIDCRFGPACRFSRDMHGIDMKIVRTTKV